MVAQDTQKPRRSKYVSHRRNSLAAAFGDDDDMREEIDKLAVTQSELQMELNSVMKMVEVMHGSSNFGGDDSNSDFQASFVSTTSSTMNEDSTSDFPVVEEDFTTSNPTRATQKSFASGFFQLTMAPETLETQKRRQMELLKENLKSIDPDLRDVVDCQSEMQDAFVQKQKQLDELKAKKEQRLEALRRKRTSTLQEEKQKQLEILKLNLQTIDPDLKDVVDCQQETQEELIERKKQEMAKVKAAVNEKLLELNLANKPQESSIASWGSTRRSLGKMMSFRTRKQQEANWIGL